MKIRVPLVLLALAMAVVSPASAQLAPVEGDFDIPDFHFESGQALPKLRMHYRALGAPRRDEQGVVRNVWEKHLVEFLQNTGPDAKTKGQTTP